MIKIYFNPKIFYYEINLIYLAFKYGHFETLLWTLPFMWKQCVNFRRITKGNV